MMPVAESHELPRTGQPSPSSPAPAWTDSLRHLTARQVTSWTLEALTPAVLSRRKGQATRAHSSTAWLDGLRGWAAFSVCIFHLTVHTHVGIEACYGAVLPGGGLNVTPAAWPVLRLLWSGGHFAVLVFYTISGYVLPRRLISLLHEGRRADFLASLHSAICRRPSEL